MFGVGGSHGPQTEARLQRHREARPHTRGATQRAKEQTFTHTERIKKIKKRLTKPALSVIM